MTKQEFKNEYLMDAFFWINEENHIQIQSILQEFNIICHTGRGFIFWHKGFNNLVTFKPDKHHNFEYYQKADMFLPSASYGEPKNVKQLIKDYGEIE